MLFHLRITLFGFTRFRVFSRCFFLPGKKKNTAKAPPNHGIVMWGDLNMPSPGYSEISKWSWWSRYQPTYQRCIFGLPSLPPTQDASGKWRFRLGSPVKIVHNPWWLASWVRGRSNLYQASNINPDAPWDGNIYLGISSCSCGHFSPFMQVNIPYMEHLISRIITNQEIGEGGWMI